jgi:hypothetical protein
MRRGVSWQERGRRTRWGSTPAGAKSLKRLLPLYAVVFAGFVGYSLMITVFTPMVMSNLDLLLRKFRGQTDSVSEIEFCTLYVVAERWILGCILRFMHAKNHFSDTLQVSPFNLPRKADLFLRKGFAAEAIAREKPRSQERDLGHPLDIPSR